MNPLTNRPLHTYSIVARDPDTGDMGVAVQSHWFSVGALVSWAEAGVGAIATQSFVNVSFGPQGLARLRAGQTAPQVLQTLLEADEGRALRQVAVVDAAGNVAAHTGEKCVPQAGHIVGEGFSVQANMMLDDQVWPAMAQAYIQSQAPLPERLVAALEAAQEQGGDIRGQQSAALLVVRAQASGQIWQDRLVDLRVEDHAHPVAELERLLRLFRAYEYMNQGDAALEENQIDAALQAYEAAQAMFPDNLEMTYWHAISLANLGRLERALPMFRAVFSQDPNWHTLTQRLPQVGLLEVSPEDYQRILAQP